MPCRSYFRLRQNVHDQTEARRIRSLSKIGARVNCEPPGPRSDSRIRRSEVNGSLGEEASIEIQH
jgi:hypothetical protein